MVHISCYNHKCLWFMTLILVSSLSHTWVIQYYFELKLFFELNLYHYGKHLEKKVKAPPLFNVLSEAARTVFREYSTYCLMVPAFITHFCQFAVFTMGPKFYKDVYHFQLSKNRWYAIVPMLTPCIGAPISGLLVQMISKKLSFSVSMKIVHTFGNLIPCITFFLIAFVPDLEVLHAMIILAVTFTVFARLVPKFTSNIRITIISNCRSWVVPNSNLENCAKFSNRSM